MTGPLGTTRVILQDRCESCVPGDLDLSYAAFSKIARIVDVIFTFFFLKADEAHNHSFFFANFIISKGVIKITWSWCSDIDAVGKKAAAAILAPPKTTTTTTAVKKSSTSPSSSNNSGSKPLMNVTKYYGQGTYYLPDGGYGACGTPLQNSDMIAAMVT